MKLLDLFSGIGGFSLAASWVGIETVAFCENNNFCRKVLKKHWPDKPIFYDVRRLNGYKVEKNYGPIDIITGGIPCQPASQAGKRNGAQDDRWLWPDAFRLVREINPTWCLFENVYGLITLKQGVEFEKLLFELEGIGYEVQAFVIPACAVDAPHRRDRVWIVANTVQPRLPNRYTGENSKWSYAKPAGENSGPKWATWKTEPDVDRVVARLSGRVDRLKGLGNAIVPQVTYEIFKAIVEAERKSTCQKH